MLLDILFPPKCAFCGALMARMGDGICPACRKTLPRIPPEETLRRAGAYPCTAALWYEGAAREGVLGLKFHGKPNRARVYGPLIARAAESLREQVDCVTYVPVSAWRRFTRGYDQARLLAGAVAAYWDLPVERTLKKTRNNRPQSSLNARERARNVKGVYRAVRPNRIGARRFLLVDDVLTTGSTLSACAGTLTEAGAARVVCAVLATGKTE